MTALDVNGWHDFVEQQRGKPLTQEQLDSMKPKPYTRAELEQRIQESESRLYRLLERLFTGQSDEWTEPSIRNLKSDLEWLRPALEELQE